MKKFKKATMLVCGLLAALFVGALSGCAGDGNSVADSTQPNNSASASTSTSENPNTENPDGTTTYVFEAEYTDVSMLRGWGYSGGATGVAAILNTRKYPEMGASNGYFVSFLYNTGLTLTFEINSDKAVENATLVLRLSAEMKDFTINGDTYSVMVNDQKVPYNDIYFEGVPPMASGAKYPFADYTITTTLSLKEGENVIKLVTTNEESMGGTMHATAPMVDCIKITTDAILTWEPEEDNIVGR